jgi:hypothetical protein
VVRADLAKIGIRARIERFHNPGVLAKRDPRAKIDLIGNEWYEPPYADSAEFLRSLLLATGLEHWLPPGVEEDAVEVAGPQPPEGRGVVGGLEGAERQRAAAKLADRLAVDEVAFAAESTGVVGSFLSPRLGCRVFPPFGYGVDLAALCLN